MDCRGEGRLNLYGYAAGGPLSNSNPFRVCVKIKAGAVALDGPLSIEDMIFGGICCSARIEEFIS